LISVHSCEQRSRRKEEPDQQEWIQNCLSQTGPFVLRTIDSKSLLIEILLSPARDSKPLTMTDLIDSGCLASAFADRDTVKQHGIQITTLQQPRTLLLADGRTSDMITDYFIAPIAIGNHKELSLFFVTTLSKSTPLILGLPWLQHHNPSID
jgi:hypothetical protein